MTIAELLTMPPLRVALIAATVEEIAEAFELEPKTIEGYAKRTDWKPTNLDQTKALNKWITLAIDKVKTKEMAAAEASEQEAFQRAANEAVRKAGEAHFVYFAEAISGIATRLHKTIGKWVEIRLTLEGNSVRYVAHLDHQPIPNGHGFENLWNANAGVMAQRAFEAIAQAIKQDFTALLYLLPKDEADTIRSIVDERDLSGYLRATMGDDPWTGPTVNPDNPDAPLKGIFSEDQTNDTPLRVLWEGTSLFPGLGPVRLVLVKERKGDGAPAERLYHIKEDVLLHCPGLADGWRSCKGKTIRFTKPRHGGDNLSTERVEKALW